MRRLRFTITPHLLELCLSMPEHAHIVGIEWDYAAQGAQIFVEHPGFPEVEAGAVIPHVSPCIMTNDNGSMKTWDWNLGSASPVLPSHLQAMALQVTRDLADKPMVQGFFGRWECPECRQVWSDNESERHKVECLRGRARAIHALNVKKEEAHGLDA